MKLSAPLLVGLSVLFCPMSHAADHQQQIQEQIQHAQTLKLAQQVTWQRLMYANAQGESAVKYPDYFLTDQAKSTLEDELKAHIAALYQSALPNESVRCRFPARSQWLMQQLALQNQDLPKNDCPELEQWLAQIQPYKTTLVYATDFMGNPSSMFGHTLLRFDPQDQKQLNLVSYAVNYAATVKSEDQWSYAWKGLTGQYPGEYSLMPYYHKVKEYGDLESRDLWEYELNFSAEETRFLLLHLWEMQNVSFPYYFVSDNCAYRLLGLIDLIRPELNLAAQFKAATIPIESLKALAEQGLIQNTVYRPALETQLLAQAAQHGTPLAKQAHQLTSSKHTDLKALLQSYSEAEQAKLLEMAYDDLYLQLNARKVEARFAEPRLRQLLILRSGLNIVRQRQVVQPLKFDPKQAHHARNMTVQSGQLQGDTFINVGIRQAYHDLTDPQVGLRTGTQLLFLAADAQYRQQKLKLNQLDVLAVNSYNPMTAFKTPLSWGFNLNWQQEALENGQFSETEQHGVAHLQAQVGYTIANQQRQHLCYAQLQSQLQAGQALDQGWRIGLGPTLGCQNIWSTHMLSVLQFELPYWQQNQQWQFKLKSQLSYMLNPQNTLNMTWQYQQQDDKHWQAFSFGYRHFFK